MASQAVVTINGNQWSVAVATTTSELFTGLSGRVSLPPGSGMLFNMGSDRSSIPINMSEMNFSLDIVFINSSGVVVDVIRGAVPGVDVVGAGGQFFLEVNAGEAVDVNVGDTVLISGDDDGGVTPSFWAGLITAVVAVSQIAIIGSATYKEIKGK